tara:strand:+ start:411 stop:1292 length:882 start_codon:yes stop_codon:yes gene_type:complete
MSAIQCNAQDKHERAESTVALAKEPLKFGKLQLKDDQPTRRMCGFCKEMTIDVPVYEDGRPKEDKSNQLIPPPKEKKDKHPAFYEYQPPYEPSLARILLFLAGSIEMGAAVTWQKRLIAHLEHLPIQVSNPRKESWDPKVDVKSVDVKFRSQVEWELAALKRSTLICFFFDTDTISPVTLMELGLWATSGKVIVCCGEKYWRSGNVDIVCDRYNIPRVDSFENLIPAVQDFLRMKGMVLDEQGNLLEGELQIEEPEMAEGKQWWLKYRDSQKLLAENAVKKEFADWKAADRDR